MSEKTRDYVQAGIMAVIIFVMAFIFDLPRLMVNVAIAIPLVILVQWLLPPEKKVKKRTENIYIACLFFIFCVMIFLLDLPKKLYLFMVILFISHVGVSLLLRKKEVG